MWAGPPVSLAWRRPSCRRSRQRRISSAAQTMSGNGRVTSSSCGGSGTAPLARAKTRNGRPQGAVGEDVREELADVVVDPEAGLDGGRPGEDKVGALFASSRAQRPARNQPRFPVVGLETGSGDRNLPVGPVTVTADTSIHARAQSARDLLPVTVLTPERHQHGPQILSQSRTYLPPGASVCDWRPDVPGTLASIGR